MRPNETPDVAPLAYEPREAAMSAGLPRLAMVLAVVPMIAAAAATAGYILTDSDVFGTIGLFVAAGGLGCLLASAVLMSMWLRRAKREGTPDHEIWYRRRRVSVAMVVNIPVTFACIGIGNYWASSVLLTVTNVGPTPVQDVRMEYVGATRSFGDLAPGQSRSRRFFPGTGQLAGEWVSEGTKYARDLENNAEFGNRTILIDRDLAHGK